MSRPANCSTHALIEQLSPRQRDVLRLVARGLTNQEIGGVLRISSETVRTHVTALLTRLDVSNRTEAATAWAAWAAQIEHIDAVLARPAIAVLPLVTPGEDPTATALAVGLTHDLTDLFARWCWFPVIAGIAARGARQRGDTVKDLGERLGARFLVDGTLRAAADAWRLGISIAEAPSGRCVFSATYDFPRAELFSVQDEVCQAVVAAAYPQLIAAAQVVVARGSADLGAWELTHRALLRQGARDRSGNLDAQADFRSAIAQDPTLLLAHFGLGLTAYDEVLNQWGRAEPALRLLEECVESCLRLAPHMAEGHYLAGRLLQGQGAHARAVTPLEAAIGRNPSFAAAHAVLAQALLLSGVTDEGMRRMRHACRLGPGAYVAGLATAHFARREYPAALAAAEQALVRTPRYPFARILAAASAYWAEEPARAAEHASALRALHPDFSPADFRRTFGADMEAPGRIAEALAILGGTR